MPLITLDHIDSVDVRATLIADIIAHVFGDSAESLINSNGSFAKSENAASAFFKAARRQRNQSTDPRDGDGDGVIFDGTPQQRPAGRFQKKNTEQQIKAIHASIEQALQGNRTANSANELVDQLGRLTVKELRDIKIKYGMSASGRNKAELVAKIAARLDSGRRADHSKNPVRHAHPGVKLNEDDRYAMQGLKASTRGLDPSSQRYKQAEQINDALEKVRTGQPLSQDEKTLAVKALTTRLEFLGTSGGSLAVESRKRVNAAKAALSQLGEDPEKILSDYRQKMSQEATTQEIQNPQSRMTPEPEIRSERPRDRMVDWNARREQARREVEESRARQAAAAQSTQTATTAIGGQAIEQNMPDMQTPFERSRRQYNEYMSSVEQQQRQERAQRSQTRRENAERRMRDAGQDDDTRPNHELTLEEYTNKYGNMYGSMTADVHRRLVKRAIESGVQVEDRVLDSYPDLKPQKPARQATVQTPQRQQPTMRPFDPSGRYTEEQILQRELIDRARRALAQNAPYMSQERLNRMIRQYPDAAPENWMVQKSVHTGIVGQFFTRAMMLKEATVPTEIKDGDGDGMIYDGTPQERSANPQRNQKNYLRDKAKTPRKNETQRVQGEQKQSQQMRDLISQFHSGNMTEETFDREYNRLKQPQRQQESEQQKPDADKEDTKEVQIDVDAELAKIGGDWLDSLEEDDDGNLFFKRISNASVTVEGSSPQSWDDIDTYTQNAIEEGWRDSVRIDVENDREFYDQVRSEAESAADSELDALTSESIASEIHDELQEINNEDMSIEDVVKLLDRGDRTATELRDAYIIKRRDELIDDMMEGSFYSDKVDDHIQSLEDSMEYDDWFRYAEDSGYLEGVDAGDYQVEQKLNELGLNINDLTTLIGAPDDWDFTVTYDHDHDGILVHYEDGRNIMSRVFHHNEDGELAVYNAHFRLDPNAPKGMGLEIFQNAVAACREQGVVEFTTHAAGSWRNTGPRDYVGFAVWPTFGYQFPIQEFDANMQAKIAAAYPDAQDVRDIFDQPGGSAWWWENGQSMDGAKFDLRDGSRSISALNQYLGKKKAERQKVREKAAEQAQ